MTKTLSTVKTRRALAADAEDIAGLLAVLGYPANTMEVTARMERFDQSDTSILIVAEIGERIVGVASGQLVPSIHDSALVGQLTGLVVDTAFQRRGVGATLTETVSDSVLQGDLLVIGRGDPTISDRFHGSALTAMEAIADSIRARGVKRVTGVLRQGGNAFPDSIYGYGWEWEDLSGSSGAPVDELLYNEGMVQRVTKIDGRDTTVAVATRTPGYAYLSALYLALSRRGIPVEGLVDLGIDSLTTPYDTLYSFQSPPLSEILKHFLKPSQNQIGESLLKTMGLEKTGVGVADSGAAVMRRQLAAWGVDSSGVVVYDGSGLSRHDLTSPETIVKTLVAMMADSATFAVFYDALPVAGVDGTIRSRMLGTPAEGNLRAKTGTIEFVRSLSGYVSTASDDLLVFAFLANHFTVPVAEVTRIHDAMGVLLASYRSPPAQ